jgi:exosome complex component RRP42
MSAVKTMNDSKTINEDNRKHIINAIKQNIRADGRSSQDYRDVKVEYGTIASAEGSAKVTIGETVVIAGVKMSLETPYPDTPDQGNFMVNVELLPLSSSEFESGPPSIKAIELARVTDRGIRESKAIDVKKLCIKPGEKVWSILVDICTINDAGNLFDACSFAALAAIKDTKLPVVNEENGRMVIDYKHKTDESLPLEKLPLGITICRVGDVLLVDPLAPEEQVVDTRLTIASMEDGTLCALQKGGSGVLTVDEISQMLDLGVAKAKELREKL